MLRNIRVLVVDDSALIRRLISRALEQDPRIEIVGTARDGVQAIEKARDLGPDVITLDIQMPELTGLEALPYITRSSDARVVILSSVDDADVTYQALSAGAVDFLTKPSGGVASSLAELSEVLIKKVKVAYRVAPEKRTRQAESPTLPPAPLNLRDAGRGIRKLVAIAASTGGPPALEKVFSGLRAELPGAFLVVQHLPSGFSASLARRLGRVTDIAVVEAADRQRIEQGIAYVAPHGTHMEVEAEAGSALIRLVDGPPLHGVKPSADRLFLSLARELGERGVGVVLSGMGSDGAQGMREMYLRGSQTIAQDEETSVVWGMPGAAVKTGGVRQIVPLDLVAAEIRRTFRS